MSECVVIPQAPRSGMSIFLFHLMALLLHQLLTRGWNVRKGEKRRECTRREDEPRVYIPTILIAFPYSYFSPVSQLSVATTWPTVAIGFDWQSCHFYSIRQGSLATPQLLLLVLLHRHFKKSQIGSLLFYMNRNARKICNGIKGGTKLFSVRDDLPVCLLAF